MKQFDFAFGHELIVDLFAGGGGASLGIEQAFGRPVDVAVNHSPDAIGMHAANHPATMHHISDVFEVDPAAATGGRQVGLLWASPDCKHFSRAKGGVPRSKKIRALAWVVIKWARAVKPRVIALENVGEFVTWGPLGKDGQPCQQRRGSTFNRWVSQLRSLGYAVEWRELRACDYGAPTIRKRFFLVARCDGLPVSWPKETHGPLGDKDVLKGRKQPWRSAAECIDWETATHSIFLSATEGKALGLKRPLAEATLERIAKGIDRFVLDCERPFIAKRDGASAAEPFPTITANGDSVIRPGGNPLAIVVAHMEQANTGVVGHDMRSPVSTIVGKGCTQRLVETTLADPEQIADQERVRAVERFLAAYLGKARNRVRIDGREYVIVDIGLRMLSSRELFRAQGFPESYIIDVGAGGRAISKDAQVRACGNSVCPPLAKALVEVNVGRLLQAERLRLVA